MTQKAESRNPSPEQLVMERVRQHDLLNMVEMGVRVREQVAYIEGCAPNLIQKKLVGEIAAQVEGVHEVVNMLRITPMAVVDDYSLRKHLCRAFARNPRIDEAKISVQVVNGFVHLRGLMKTARKRCIAEDEVWAAPGVRGIINKLEVCPATSRNDFQIGDEILQGFSQCLGLDISKTEAAFQDGVVYLGGEVPNEHLRRAAEELACWTPSVIYVVNNLKVAYTPGSPEPSNVFGDSAPLGPLREER